LKPYRVRCRRFGYFSGWCEGEIFKLTSPTSTIAPLKKNFTCRSAGTLAVTCRKIDAAATRPGHFSHQESKKRM
jgi:hypothetical protein